MNTVSRSSPGGETVGALPVERGCGRRTQGGVYFECGVGGRKQIEEFLLDPPFVLTQAMAVPDRGVKLFEQQGVWHILDRVGSGHYPNVADFVEEARRYGVSRKLSPMLDFSKLTAHSRLLLVHDRAHIDNYDQYIPIHLDASCPKAVEGHPLQTPMCIAAWWRDIEALPGDEEVGAYRFGGVKLVWRRMPSFRYSAWLRPAALEPRYRQAIFASFPCTRLAVVQGNKHEAVLRRASLAQVPVVEVIE